VSATVSISKRIAHDLQTRGFLDEPGAFALIPPTGGKVEFTEAEALDVMYEAETKMERDSGESPAARAAWRKIYNSLHEQVAR
jgi:hypothetical protein